MAVIWTTVYTPTTDNGTSTRLPPSPLSPVLYNVYTKGLADLNSNGLGRVLTLADDGRICKTASDINTSHRCAGAAGKGVTLVPKSIQARRKPSGAPSTSSRTSNASSLLQWRSHKTHKQSHIPRDPLRQNADAQDRLNQQN